MRTEIRYNDVTPELWLVIGHQAFELALYPGDDSPEDCARWHKDQVDKALARQAAALQEAHGGSDALPPGVVSSKIDNGIHEGEKFVVGDVVIIVSRQATIAETRRYIISVPAYGDEAEIGTVAEVRDALPLVRAIAQIIENE